MAAMLQLARRSTSATMVTAHIGETLGFMLRHESLFLRLIEQRILDFAVVFLQHTDANIRNWAVSLLSNLMSLHEGTRIELGHESLAIATLLKLCDERHPEVQLTMAAANALTSVALVSPAVAAKLVPTCQAAAMLAANLADAAVTDARYKLLWCFLRCDALKDALFARPQVLPNHFTLLLGSLALFAVRQSSMMGIVLTIPQNLAELSEPQLQASMHAAETVAMVAFSRWDWLLEQATLLSFLGKIAALLLRRVLRAATSPAVQGFADLQAKSTLIAGFSASGASAGVPAELPPAADDRQRHATGRPVRVRCGPASAHPAQRLPEHINSNGRCTGAGTGTA